MFILAMRIMLRLWEVFFWHFLHRASTISSILDWAIMPIPLKIHQKKRSKRRNSAICGESAYTDTDDSDSVYGWS